MKKNFISMLLATCLITSGLTTSAFASTTLDKDSSTKLQQGIGFNNPTISATSLKKLLNKYDIELLSPTQVKDLDLNEKNTLSLPESISLNDLEKYIVEYKNLPDIKEVKEVTIPVKIDSTSNLSKKNSLLMRSSGYAAVSTYYGTKTFYRDSSNLTDLTIRTSAAGSYQYDVIPLPGEPDIVSNLHFTSCDNGAVTALTSGGYNRLATVNSSRCIINTSTQLKHDYSYVADMYTKVGIPGTPLEYYFKISSRTVTGTAYYNLSI